MALRVDINSNYLSIIERMEKAARRAGRNPAEISLLAVTKYRTAEEIRAAHACGIRLFGENRVQEAILKYDDSLRSEIPDFRLDMLGALQSNKAGKAARFFDSVQSVDSISLVEFLKTKRPPEFPPLNIYLELRTGETSKSGFLSVDDLLRAVEVLVSCHECESQPIPSSGGLKFLGLMTMAPFTQDVQAIRKAFRSLNHAGEAIVKRFSRLQNLELSMGMTQDFEIAIEEGSTLVRIGTGLFGERSP